MTQASCRARWGALHPGRQLVAGRTTWTEELKATLKNARHSRPAATWATIVNGNASLKDIGVVRHDGDRVQ